MKLVPSLFGIATLILFSGCSTTQQMTIESVPTGKTREQVQLDNLNCHNVSKTQAPLLFGIGLVISAEMSKTKFTECMSSLGYKVRPQ